MPSTFPTLSLEGFGIAFGERQILKNIDLSLQDTGCTVLLGPSGTGKSTLLRTLAGFNDANPHLRIHGDAHYLGHSCPSTGRPALVTQHSRLLVSNVFENLVCALPQRADLNRREQLELIEALLTRWEQHDLLEMLNVEVVSLPAVEQRIVAILRELTADPALLMIDEPSAGLPEADAERLLTLVGRISQERHVLLVLHNMAEARRFAQRCVLMANGVVVESADVETFFTAPVDELTRKFITTGSCPELTREEAEEDLAPQGEDTPAPSERKPSPAAAPTISAGIGPRGFLWLLPAQLAGTPYPGIINDTADDLGALRDAGVTCLVSLTEQPFPADQAKPFGIRCHGSPIIDMHAPTMEQALDLCRFIEAALSSGDVVAVHCRAGLGRTGTILAAYELWRTHGTQTALEVLERIRRIEPLWVQSPPQVAFLEEFAQQLTSSAALMQ